MKSYYVMNVKNLRLYEPPMIDDHEENVQIPSIDNFAPEYLDELQEDIILNKITRLHIEAMWSIFEWNSKLPIHVKKGGFGSGK